MKSYQLISILFLVSTSILACQGKNLNWIDSCDGRCGDKLDNSFDCQCNTACEKYEDCCDDYDTLCLGEVTPKPTTTTTTTTTGSPTLPTSCKGKCGTTGTNATWPCQCNKQCVNYGDCCPDYDDECGDGELPGGVSDADIKKFTEELYLLEAENENNAGSFVTTDLQGHTSQGGSSDLAPDVLLTVDPAAFQKNTIALLLKLHDNYIPAVGSAEQITAEETAEEEAFLDAVFATPLFQKTRAFLISKGYLTETNFRDTFHQIWFGQYSRSGSTLGSSGFEHVFLGELKSGEVSGFHNWLYFNREESNSNLNYRGYLDYASFGERGSLVAHNFLWRSNPKPISSMFVGTSPELEMALFTTCWYTRPNGKCAVSLNGVNFLVQTYDIAGPNGKKYVASSYADVSS